MFTDVQKDKENTYIHTLDFYSVTKNNEIWMFAISYILLEGIMLSGISHTEKAKYQRISLTCRM